MTTLDNLYLVGLPVTPATASEEFLSFLTLPKPTIGLTGGIVMNRSQMNQINAGQKVKVAPPWDFLINDGYKFTISETDIKADEKIVFMKDRWGPGIKSADVAQQIVTEYTSLNAEYPDSKIAFFMISSPHLWNDVAKILIPQVPAENVIDNPHAPNIAYDLLLDFELIPTEPINISSPFDLSIQPNKVNMVGLLSNNDADLTEFKRIIEENPTASIHKVILSYVNEIDELSGAELIAELNSNRRSFQNSVVSVVLKN
jgi:hypothetical protein